MTIEVLDKHYGGLTILKNETIEWCGNEKIIIKFRKKGNDMQTIKNAAMLRIFEDDKISYIPIMQLFDRYSDEKAEIIGSFMLVREV